jgi:hypothetical protein
MMVAVGVFLSIFVGVMVAVQIFGMRVSTLAATKLIATAGSRKAMNQIREQVREAKTFNIGNCSSAGPSSFTLISTSKAQQGNALQIFFNLDTNNYSVYYLNTNNAPTNKLMVYTVITNSFGTNTIRSQVLTSFITNQMIFTAEDYGGNILTNVDIQQNRLVVKVTFQYSQWEYPIARIGGIGFDAYDYYQLRTRIFRRAWN